MCIRDRRYLDPSSRLATTDMGWKSRGAVTLCGGSWAPSNTKWSGRAEAYLHTKWHLDPSNRLATIHQRHKQDRIDRQRSDSIRRTVLQTVAQKPICSDNAVRIKRPWRQFWGRESLWWEGNRWILSRKWDWGSYGCREWWIDRERRCGRYKYSVSQK